MITVQMVSEVKSWNLANLRLYCVKWLLVAF